MYKFSLGTDKGAGKELVENVGEFDYFRDRLIPQIHQYDNEAIKKKKIYKRTSIFQLIANTLIPIIVTISTSIEGFNIWNIILAILAGISSIAIGLENIMKHHQTYLRSRMTCEMLQRELILFQEKNEPYHTEKAKEVLVARCERIMENEQQDWQVIFSKSINSVENQSLR